MIGIVGGMGPYAGLDLNRKIFDAVQVTKDQDYPQVSLLSLSSRIGDRTDYLLHPHLQENPGFAIAGVLQLLEGLGARVAGIPCNTAHAPAIFDVIQEQQRQQSLTGNMRIIHLIQETKAQILSAFPSLHKVGLLATQGTYKVQVYQHFFSQERSLEVLCPPPEEQALIHQAIYHPEYGIKSSGSFPYEKAKEILLTAADRLLRKGAEIIIMGCTEIPLVMEKEPLPLVDPTRVLAAALLREDAR